MIGAGAAALGALAALAVLVEDPATGPSPGDLVTSNHVTAGCPTEDPAKTLSPTSPAALAAMVKAGCKAIAPETRLVVVGSVEKGVMRVQLVGGVAEPLFVLARDFDVVRPRS